MYRPIIPHILPPRCSTRSEVLFSLLYIPKPSVLGSKWKLNSSVFERLNKLKCYNNTNKQIDATTMVFINNPNHLNTFRAMISPILRSTRLCFQLVVQCTDDAAGCS